MSSVGRLDIGASLISSFYQISEYRNLLTVTTTGEYVADADGMVNVDEDIYMYNNFRPDQPLNGRTVYSRI